MDLISVTYGGSQSNKCDWLFLSVLVSLVIMWCYLPIRYKVDLITLKEGDIMGRMAIKVPWTTGICGDG